MEPEEQEPISYAWCNMFTPSITGYPLIVIGSLSIIFNIVDLAVGTTGECGNLSLSEVSNGTIGHGFWCGIMVSVVFHF